MSDDLTEEIGFRVSSETFHELKDRAKNRSDKSPHLYARQIIKDYLGGESIYHELLDHLASTRKEVEELNLRVFNLEQSLASQRKNFAMAVHVLLEAIHRPDPSATREDIAGWVAENLNQ